MKSDERDESAHKSLQLRDHSPSPGEGTIPKEWEPGRRVFMTIYQCGHISDPEERPTMPTASIVPVYYLAACDERCHARISLVLAGGITENVEARCLFATPGAAYDFLSKQFITDSEEITKEKKRMIGRYDGLLSSLCALESHLQIQATTFKDAYRM